MIVSHVYDVIKYFENNKEQILKDYDLTIHLLDLKKLLEEL